MPRPWITRVNDMLGATRHFEKIAKVDQFEEIIWRLAFERAFEILSEASRHLPIEVKTRYPQIGWQDLADLGNIIRHVYDRVSIGRLQETARVHVPPLKMVLIEITSRQSSA